MAGAPWYDLDTIDQMHADMRAGYAEVAARVANRPVLQKHIRECTVCAELKNGAGVRPLSTRRRLRVVLDADKIHKLLGLAPEHEIVFMYAEMDPNKIHILVAGADLPETPATAPTPASGAA